MTRIESPSAVSESNSETIELDELEEITVTPDRHHHRHPFRQESLLPDPELLDDDDDDTLDANEDARALLGSHAHSRDESTHPPLHTSTWGQVKGIVIQTTPTLLITTVGLLFTGEILNKVSHWKALSRVDELIMIIPVVLNLKGNLEMNLSARLGTAANVGELDKSEARRSIILGNLMLLQVQAALVSFVAACVSFVLGRIVADATGEQAAAAVAANSTATAIVERVFLSFASAATSSSHLETRKIRPVLPTGGKKISGASEFIMVASAAMTATALSSLVLGSSMCTLIILCWRFGLDPDNIAPPVAGCLGDLVTLSILAIVSVIHVRLGDTPVPIIMVILLTLAAVGWAILVRRNVHVKHLLTEGWSPLFAAMIISSGTGLVLDTFVSRYKQYALVAVVITGLPGSVGAIFVSRLSTALHVATKTILPSSADHKAHPTPRLVLITLLVVSLPIQLIFLAIVYAFGWVHLPILFALFEVLFFCIVVFISLSLAQIATNFLWTRKLDPDMYALPLHSAFMDLVGQSLLVACYEVVSLLGSDVRAKTAN